MTENSRIKIIKIINISTACFAEKKNSGLFPSFASTTSKDDKKLIVRRHW
jgi:hypothetical protein